MLVTHKLCLDLIKRGCQPVVAAVQGEANTRQLAISLFSNSVAWEIPEGATAAVAFQKPDGTKGLYDKLPTGEPATEISGSTVTAILAPQALTCAGIVLASVVFYDAEGDTLATFPFKITVEKNPAAGEQISNDYYNPSIFDMDAAVKALELRVEDLEKGNTGGGNSGGGGLSATAANLLIEILESAVFNANVSGKIASLKEALTAGGGGSGGDEPVVPDVPDIPDEPDEPVVVDDITVADGTMTIITVGSVVNVADGVMTIA